MTGPYDWNPMPPVLDVACPRCGGAARFEFATIVRIRENRLIPVFERHRQLDVRRFAGRDGRAWTGAVFFPGVGCSGAAALRDLPEGHTARDWAHLQRGGRLHPSLGAVRCGGCGAAFRHDLAWPADAWFQVAHRGHVLWAFDRAHAEELHAYIASEARDRTAFRRELALRHIPAVFLERRARARVCALLERRLAEGGTA